MEAPAGISDFGDLGEFLRSDAGAPQPMPPTPNAPAPQSSAPQALERDQPAPGAPVPVAPTGPDMSPTPAPNGARGVAGAGLLAAVLAGGVGYALGGGWGLAAGVLLLGGARNAARASRLWGKQQDEASGSAAAAVFGVGAGALLAYKAYEAKR